MSGRARCVQGLNDYEYCFSFSVEGGKRSPEELTGIFGIEPTASHRQGEPRTTRGGKPRDGVWSGNYWSCEQPVVSGASVSESVDAFLVAMRPYSSELTSLVENGAELCLFVGLFANQLCDDQLPPSILRELGELGVALRLDYYSNDAMRAVVDSVGRRNSRDETK